MNQESEQKTIFEQQEVAYVGLKHLSPMVLYLSKFPSLRGNRGNRPAHECISGRKLPCEGSLLEAIGNTDVKGTQRARSPKLIRVQNRDRSQSKHGGWRNKVR